MTQHEMDYYFDLNGFLILDEALSSEQLASIHAYIDKLPEDMEDDQWLGDVQLRHEPDGDGWQIQNIVEGGPVFEELIDHPSWVELVSRYICNDYNKLSIDEAFLYLRGSGSFVGVHSGGHFPAPIMTFRHHTGAWQLGQINILMALDDIGPGDGATVVIPGSHKSVVEHPILEHSKVSNYVSDPSDPIDLPGAVEVYLKAGQALMFTDAVMHGGAARTNPGRRKVCIYRYVPHAIMPRYNYLPSPELLERLTPARRAIMGSHPEPRLAPGRVIRGC